MVIEKGQIYWCGLDPVQGHEQGLTRPAIIITADAYNQTRGPLTAIAPDEISRKEPDSPAVYSRRNQAGRRLHGTD